MQLIRHCTFSVPCWWLYSFHWFCQQKFCHWVVGGRYKIRAVKRGYLFTACMDMVYKLILQANAKYTLFFSV